MQLTLLMLLKIGHEWLVNDAVSLYRFILRAILLTSMNAESLKGAAKYSLDTYAYK